MKQILFAIIFMLLIGCDKQENNSSQSDYNPLRLKTRQDKASKEFYESENYKPVLKTDIPCEAIPVSAKSDSRIQIIEGIKVGEIGEIWLISVDGKLFLVQSKWCVPIEENKINSK